MPYALTDEIYEYIRFTDAPHISMATLPGMAERTVTISGLSKTFSMTGWRLGYCIAPAEITQRHPQGARFPDGRRAASAANGRGRGARTAGELLRQAARPITSAAATCSCPTCATPASTMYEPDGAYYVMTDIDRHGLATTITDFVRTMIRAIGVSAVPGSSFYRPEGTGQDEGALHVRQARRDAARSGQTLAAAA